MGDMFGMEPDVPEFYVDSIRLAASLYTFTFELGLSQPRDTPGSEAPPIKRLALVRMSPQHARILVKILQKNVRKYEEDIGPIKIPDSVYKELDLDPDGDV